MNNNTFNSKELVYFDIETSGPYATFDEFQEKEPAGAEIFLGKVEKLSVNDISWRGTNDEVYLRKTSILPAFGRIICISISYFKNGELKTKSLTGTEEEIITKFQGVLNNASKLGWGLCGYNIYAFDIPWVTHKMIKYNLTVPSILNVFNKKPWEIRMLDLYRWWSVANHTSLNEMCYEVGIRSSKEVMKGDETHFEFYRGNIEKIATYCEQDVRVCVEMVEKMQQFGVLD